ncbi:MAG: hypothetical protein KatS3mg050_4895 [Litorilinea sp.]|nr:MAG: hypothetical protein KatS3mg050_4895 [Litorilinea sp.]
MISATIRDIAIIIIAVESIVIGALIAVLVWQVWRLVRLLQTEIRPIIDDAQETIHTVRGTASFVSDNVVEPVIRTSGNVVRVRRTVQALFTDLRPLRRRGQASSTGAPSSPPASHSANS